LFRKESQQSRRVPLAQGKVTASSTAVTA